MSNQESLKTSETTCNTEKYSLEYDSKVFATMQNRPLTHDECLYLAETNKNYHNTKRMEKILFMLPTIVTIIISGIREIILILSS